MAGVGGSFRQTSHRLHQFFAAQLAGRSHTSSLHQFRKRGTASHRGDASFGKKTDSHDTSILNLEAQFQNIAASRILKLNGDVRIRNFARIPRMLEVIEKLSRIH